MQELGAIIAVLKARKFWLKFSYCDAICELPCLYGENIMCPMRVFRPNHELHMKLAGNLV